MGRIHHCIKWFYTEEDIQAAMLRLKEDPTLSIRKVARVFDIPHNTLLGRLSGRQSAQSAHVRQMRLTPAQERILCDWLEFLAHTARPVRKKQIGHYVAEISGSATRVSKQWIRRFLQRHPELRLGRPSGLDPKRARCFNKTVVEDYFKKLQKLIGEGEDRIPYRNIYNMDEKGCQCGGGRRLQKCRYFVPRDRRIHYRFHSESLELVTIIECVNAEGEAIQPGFIFSGKEYLSKWFEVHPEICVSLSKNGWTDAWLCHQWFEKCFIPQVCARRRNPSEKILLLLDGHNSHSTYELQMMAVKHNIEILTFPAHCTHRLQPLDVGCFGPLQHHWEQVCAKYIEVFQEDTPREDFVVMYCEARNRALTQETIKGAWERCGINPLNPFVFTNADYGPSEAFSTAALHVPSSFPLISEDTTKPIKTTYEVADESDNEDSGTDSSNDEAEHELEGAWYAGDINTAIVGEVGVSDEEQVGGGLSRVETVTMPLNQASSDAWLASASMPQLLKHFQQQTGLEYFPTQGELLQMFLSQNKQLEEVKTHGKILQVEVQRLNTVLESKKKRKPSTRVKIYSKCLTSATGIKESRKIYEKKQEEKEKAEAIRRARRDKEIGEENERLRLRGQRTYKGPLKGKKMAELKDIMVDLGIEMREGDKNADRTERILGFLHNHPTLRSDVRYQTLYPDFKAWQVSTNVPFSPAPLAPHPSIVYPPFHV